MTSQTKAAAPSSPRVSVIIGAYDAGRTIERCLLALRAQTYRDFDVILTDSSPDDSTAVVAARFPEIRFERSARRLYCHEARNHGVSVSHGELLACLDADVYPDPGWLAELVGEFDRTGQVIVGAIDCYGTRLSELGMHYGKFAKFLPAGRPRAIDSGPTANLLLTRHDFIAIGGLQGGRYLADVEMGRSLELLGRQLRFLPTAIVEHHHTQTLPDFVRERFVRGRLFGEMRGGWLRDRRRIALYLAISVLPLRLSRIMLLVANHCRQAGRLTSLLLSFPIVLIGHASWLAGESIAYGRALLHPPTASLPSMIAEPSGHDRGARPEAAP